MIVLRRSCNSFTSNRNPKEPDMTAATQTAKALNVTQQLDALFDAVGGEALALREGTGRGSGP
jgi:hypothetical protein